MSEQRVHDGKVSLYKHLSVWHFFAPLDATNATKAAHVETVQLLFSLGNLWKFRG